VRPISSVLHERVEENEEREGEQRVGRNTQCSLQGIAGDLAGGRVGRWCWCKKEGSDERKADSKGRREKGRQVGTDTGSQMKDGARLSDAQSQGCCDCHLPVRLFTPAYQGKRQSVRGCVSEG
jgi:hypothetical protein